MALRRGAWVWADRQPGFMWGVPLSAGLPCDARAEVVPENSLRGLTAAPLKQLRQVCQRCALRAPTSTLCSSAPTRRPAGSQPSPLRPAGGVPRAHNRGVAPVGRPEPLSQNTLPQPPRKAHQHASPPRCHRPDGHLPRRPARVPRSRRSAPRLRTMVAGLLPARRNPLEIARRESSTIVFRDGFIARP